jgi:hypothetical protein
MDHRLVADLTKNKMANVGSLRHCLSDLSISPTPQRDMPRDFAKSTGSGEPVFTSMDALLSGL